MIVLCQFVQAGGVGFQQRRHLVDKGPRAARAHAVHAFFQSAGEIDNLRVLAAQFDGDVGLRRGLLQCFRHRDDLLYEPDAQRFRQRNCARSGHAHFHAARAELLPRSPHHLRQRFLRVCAVAAIFAPDHFSRFVQQHQLNGGRTDVNARIVIGVCFHSSTSSVGFFAATTSENARKIIGFRSARSAVSPAARCSPNRFNSPSTAKNPLDFAGKVVGFCSIGRDCLILFPVRKRRR